MEISFLPMVNYLAVFVSAAVYFAFGAVWYSPLLVSNLWVEELKKHQVTITPPAKNEMMTKMLLSFAANIVASFAMAYLVALVGSTTWQSGLVLGTIASVGFAATALASVFVWENRSVKLFLLDVGYPIVGIMILSVMLSLWR